MQTAPTTDTSPPPGTDDKLARAVARIEQSRTQLRMALAPPAATTPGSTAWPFNAMSSARTWLRASAWGVVLDPLVDVLGRSLAGWWRGQAWREAGLQVRDTFTAEVSPLVRRHPIAAIAITAVAGAALAASGLWRWSTVRRTSLQLALRMRRALVSQISSPAVQSMVLGAVVSYLAARGPATPAAGTEPVKEPVKEPIREPIREPVKEPTRADVNGHARPPESSPRA